MVDHMPIVICGSLALLVLLLIAFVHRVKPVKEMSLRAVFVAGVAVAVWYPGTGYYCPLDSPAETFPQPVGKTPGQNRL